MRQAFAVSPLIGIPIGKFLLSPAMLQEVFEAALVSLPAFAFVDPFALHDSFLPLSHVAVAFWRNPHAHSMLLIARPFAGVKLAISPPELSFSFLLVIRIRTSVST